MTTTVNRWCETTRRYLPSIVIRDDGDDSCEWWHVMADEREAERHATLEPQDRRRGVGHPVETEGGDDDRD